MDHADNEPDKQTGYYVAGHDWPAISNDFSIDDVYAALVDISDEDVEVAGRTLYVTDGTA